MITILLTLPPERVKVSVEEDTTTLQDLHTMACQKFGIKTVSFRHGFPPVELNPNNYNNGTADGSKSLSSLKIQNQDRVIVVDTTTSIFPAITPVVAAAGRLLSGVSNSSSSIINNKGNNNDKINKNGQTNKSNKSPPPSFISGLTKRHYFKDSYQTAPQIPTREYKNNNSSSNYSTGTSRNKFHWRADGSNGNSYILSAEMSANNNNGDLQAYCSCPAFSKFGRGGNQRTRDNKIRVCKHLAAALDSMVDPNYTATTTSSSSSSNATTTTKLKSGDVEVIDLLDDSDSDSDNDVIRRAQQTIGASPKKKRARKMIGAASSSSSTASTALHGRTPITITATTATKTLKKQKQIQPQAEAPIKLFATPHDLQLRRQLFSNDRSHWCWTQCKTIQEIVLGNENDNTNNPSDIQWLVISNFLIDFPSLFTQLLPILSTIPRVVIFYGQGDPSSVVSNNYNNIDVIQLDPNQPAHSPTNPLPQRHQFGTHHTKLFLIGYSHKIRVVVSTANLGENEPVLANAVYVEEFARKNDNEEDDELYDNGTSSSSEFENTLVHYMKSYGYNKKRNWINNNNNNDNQNNNDNNSKSSNNEERDGQCRRRRRELLTEMLSRYDYSTARGILIPSIPGYYNMMMPDNDDSTQHDDDEVMGQLKLRKAIQDYTPMTATEPRPVICQFSSIGNVSEKYLHSLQTSMDTYLAHRSSSSRSSITTCQEKKKKRQKKPQLQLKLVYPTVREICESVEGYRGGGTVPGREKNVGKFFLKDLWCKWSSSSSISACTRSGRNNDDTADDTRHRHRHRHHGINNNNNNNKRHNPLAKPNNVPHIKSYYQINCDENNENENAFDWLCITSHNISQAAWGTIGDNSWGGGGKRLYIRSWELGVFISPQTLGVDKLICWQEQKKMNRQSGGKKNDYSDTHTTVTTTSSTVPMPYNTHSLQPYNSSTDDDKPWAWDIRYYPGPPDRFGFHSMHG